jgi:hypothetical protein
MSKSKTKKAKVDEIEKIVGDTATVHAFGWSEDLSKQLRRRLRALVRKAYKLGENERYNYDTGFGSDLFTTAERFQIMFGVKP